MRILKRGGVIHWPMAIILCCLGKILMHRDIQYLQGISVRRFQAYFLQQQVPMAGIFRYRLLSQQTVVTVLIITRILRLSGPYQIRQPVLLAAI